MSWNDETYLVGEKVKVEGEKTPGVVTRVDIKKGVIFVLHKRMRELPYPFPEAINTGMIKPEVEKKINMLMFIFLYYLRN